MTDVFHALCLAGEPYAAGLIESPDCSPLFRHANAYARFYREAALTPYDGGMLYPCGPAMRHNGGNRAMCMKPDFSFTYSLDLAGLTHKVPDAADYFSREVALVSPIDTVHTVGGAGFTHSFICYRRILADGLSGYRKRVDALPDGDFRDAMTVLLDAIFDYRDRCLAHLREKNAPQSLIDALSYVPEHTPRNVYEALVAWNFVYYIDGCDDIGGLDRWLLPYWHGEDIVPLLSELYTHVDANSGWSGPLGPMYNALTVQCIRASAGHRRPSLQLLVTPELLSPRPGSIEEKVLEAAYVTLASSCGQPAFYNWELYRREIQSRLPEVTDTDLQSLAFGGCTETMIEGMSNVGSDDAGINTALIFDEYFREHLADHNTFDAFLEGYLQKAEDVIAEVCAILEKHRKTRALYRPQPVRTLFVDDCIDTQTDFNAGGARYYWSVINVAGLINVIDSLSAIETLVYREKRYDAATFIRLLETRDPVFLAQCERCPKHGVADEGVGRIAGIVSERIYTAFESHTCTPRGRYFPVSNQFVTYVDAGRGVRATPDGRADGDPLCDSCGAIHGRDTAGPTAMLSSTAALRLSKALGSPVTNLRMAKEHLSTLLLPLLSAFFAEGGMQLQITCASREELLDALDHPEKHESLIVRIGGYSEYFNRLSPELQQSVIARTEY